MEDYIHQSNLIEEIDKSQEDAQSMRAWAYLVTKKQIGETELLELHRLITTNQLSFRDAGSFRRENVSVGGRICPAPWLVKELVNNWLLDLKEYWTSLDPIEMHIRYEKIHPFIDGSGRSGRMLLWWHESKLGIKPTMFRNYSKHQDYYPLFVEEKEARLLEDIL